MRGKAKAVRRKRTVSGITPAYAGKSCIGITAKCTSQDHPRLCGEKVLHIVQNFFIPGSPPPMRGKGHHVRCRCKVDGITPAYAGKRLMPRNCPDCHQDHPRLCGEKFRPLSNALTTLGSPPPMRGKALLVICSSGSSGITPAYAGKRCIPLYPWNRYKDNPRLCGEKSICRRSIFGYRGSPPPMRGKV